MTRNATVLAVVSGMSLLAASPAVGAPTVYSSQAAFNAAVMNAAVYTPAQDASYATSYAFGPVTATAPFFVTYTGDYGAGVRSLGAFLSPVVYTSTHTALGLNFGYFVGPQTATYTIDGVIGTITVPDNSATPDNVFIGFVDTAPITVSFATDSAEFDTLRVTSADAAAAVPELCTWAMMVFGLGAVGFAMRRRQKVAARISYAV